MASIEGRDIAVFDALVATSEAARYFNTLAHAAFTRTETARADSPGHRHWVCEMPLENLPRISLWAATQQAVAHLRPNEEYRPYRCYTNFAAYGDVLLTHVDSAPHARELTALWFLCERWDVEWGGETLFFDTAGEAQIAVAPRPGRLLLFDGAIRHAGRPPNRNCHESRYTFAIKLRAVGP
ncbi:MAG TPA: 2OG-Fe(II) oxygenase [Povalibacter sp.]|nr:2OG-Fe(II) oxygenase [Povalibacter sp.]